MAQAFDHSVSEGIGRSIGRRAAARALAELSAMTFANTALTLLIAAGMTAIPILAHLIHPGVGMLTAFLLGGLCAWRMPQVAIVSIIFALLCQNLFVSFVADQVSSDADFDIIRGYNFVMLSVTWVVVVATYLANWRQRNQAVDPFIKVSVCVFAALGVYFMIGFVFYGMAAIVYLRNIVTPLLLFHVCMLIFMRVPVRLSLAMTVLSVLVVLCGTIEFLYRDAWLQFTNGYAYWEQSMGPNYATMYYDGVFQRSGQVLTGLLDVFSITLFNSPLFAEYDIRMLRLFGPNMHAISYAYALCFFAIFSLYRGGVILPALLLVLLVLTSTKGPLILFLMVGASWINARMFGTVFAFVCLALALVVYSAIGIVIGLRIGDYHVLGLMSGLFDFLRNPVGLGIGAGGNLSSEYVTIVWPEAQAAGRTPFAVESAVGVLLYQIGVFAFLLIGSYVWISWRVLLIARRTGNSLHLASAFGLLAVIATGLFQEEAYFSPLALGTFMALAGMVVGASARTGLLNEIDR